MSSIGLLLLLPPMEGPQFACKQSPEGSMWRKFACFMNATLQCHPVAKMGKKNNSCDT